MEVEFLEASEAGWDWGGVELLGGRAVCAREEANSSVAGSWRSWVDCGRRLGVGKKLCGGLFWASARLPSQLLPQLFSRLPSFWGTTLCCGDSDGRG